ncbi:hypothetical protein [Micromonospora sp. WMMA2032]|uniref:hypothetical protein n=1 Tax=Micromonospora sp. WMMA2032 TaxID=2039870 RepID=UPI0012FE4FEF|nr:hypothetical protein [Micromonospora sp. WMMA2032]
MVYANGAGTRQVNVRASKSALVEGYFWQNDAVEFSKTLAANTSGSTRIDLVVLRLSRSDYSVSVQVVQGTPGAGAPATTNATGTSGWWELPLAEVTVANNATTLASTDVVRRCWYLGEDGMILCKAATMPPPSPGRVVYRTDTDQYLLSNGTTWSPTAEDSGLLSLALSSGWTAALNRVQKRNGTVVVAVNVTRSTTIAAGTSVKVGQLPAGCYPTFDVPGQASYGAGNGEAVRLKVTTAGGVYVETPLGLGINAGRALDGSLTFHAAS